MMSRVWLTNCGHKYRLRPGQAVKAGTLVLCQTCHDETTVAIAFGEPLSKRYQTREDRAADLLLF